MAAPSDPPTAATPPAPPPPARRCLPAPSVEPLLFLATLALGLQVPLATQYLWDRLGAERGYVGPNASSPHGCGNGSGAVDPLREVGSARGGRRGALGMAVPTPSRCISLSGGGSVGRPLEPLHQSGGFLRGALLGDALRALE